MAARGTPFYAGNGKNDVFFPCFCVSLCLPPAGTIQWIGLWQAHRAQEVDRPLTFLMGNPWKSSKKYGNLCGKDVEFEVSSLD